MMDQMSVDKSEVPAMFKTYKESGRVQIPVSKYLRQAEAVDSFQEETADYYDSIDDLIQVLNIQHLPSDQLMRIREFLTLHSGVFFRNEFDIGRVPNYQMKVELDKEPKNFSVKFAPVARNMREKVVNILNKYREKGIISYCSDPNPLVSNIIALRKGDSGRCRIVFDARAVNYFAKKQRSHTTSVFETLRSVHLGSDFFTLLDLSSSYYCLPLHPSSRRFFAFLILPGD